MKIAIACDHGALALKEALIPFIKSLGYSVRDFGTHTEQSCDYPDYAAAAARSVASGDCDRGIVLCTTGIGVSIAANKIDGIRCALLSDVNSARMTRLHNDTNMMALGAAVVSQDLAFSIVETWLTTPFSDEDRHQRRIDKVMDLERNEKKKQRNERRRRRKLNPGTKTINFFLCLLLICTLTLLPVVTFISNIVDPAALVQTVLNPEILSDFMSSMGTPDDSDPAGDDIITDDTGSAEGESSSSSEAEGSLPVIDGLPGMDSLLSGMDISTLIGSIGSLASSGILDTEALLGDLEDLGLSEDDVDTGKLATELMGSNVATEILNTYVDDFMNAAMSENPEEYQAKLTGEFIKELVTKPENLDNLIDIVENNISDEAKQNLDADKLKEIVVAAVDTIPIEELNNTLELIKPTTAIVSLQSNPVVGFILKLLKFIRTGALRAIVLLLVIALCIVIVLLQLPGIRGLTNIGISFVFAAVSCGCTYYILNMPLLSELFGGKLGAVGTTLLPAITGLTEAHHVCTIVFGVIGAMLIVCTTILQGLFHRIFDAIFSQD